MMCLCLGTWEWSCLWAPACHTSCAYPQQAQLIHHNCPKWSLTVPHFLSEHLKGIRKDEINVVVEVKSASGKGNFTFDWKQTPSIKMPLRSCCLIFHMGLMDWVFLFHESLPKHGTFLFRTVSELRKTYLMASFKGMAEVILENCGWYKWLYTRFLPFMCLSLLFLPFMPFVWVVHSDGPVLGSFQVLQSKDCPAHSHTSEF